MQSDREGLTPQAIRILQAAARYLNTDVRLHNTLEEDALFPLMERHLPATGGPTDVMRHEHRDLWTALEELETRLVAAAQSAPDRPGVQRIVELALFISQLLTQHIHKENHILYPIAKQVFVDGEESELAVHMERIMNGAAA